MKCIELFSGNGDITKMLKEKYNIDCISVDYDENKKPDLCEDVYKLDKEFLNKFDFIWASPDCTTYSLASHGLHRKAGQIPVSNYAKECDINNEKFINMLIELDIPFIIENPRSHFRNMNFVKSLYRTTVYYSTYGADYTKPTDLFSNRKYLIEDFNTNKTRGVKHLDYCKSYSNFLGRCQIPENLLNDICKNIVKVITNEKI